MRCLVLGLLMSVSLGLVHSAYAGADEPLPQFKAGGVVLALPAPRGDYVEVGDRLRSTYFELLAPSNNRLVSAYAAPTTVARMLKGGRGEGLGSYGMVEVSRRAEYADCTPQAFDQVRQGVMPATNRVASQELQSLQDEMNLRLKSLDVGKIEIGRPKVLGTLFDKTDATGFAIVLATKQGDQNVISAAGCGLIRVKQRLLFAYLYRIYEGPSTISQIGTALAAWVDDILKANP